MRIQLTGWNTHSTRFVYSPAWAWLPIPGAAAYKVMLADRGGVRVSRTVADPRWSPEDEWDSLPIGPLDLLILGVDADGEEMCTSLHRRFSKSPGFDGGLQEPLNWRAAVARNLQYLLAPARDEVADYEAGLPRSCWSSFEDSITGERDPLAYPALHHPTYILCFLRFAEHFPSDPLAEEAVRQAAVYGDWLLANRQPAEWRFGLFPYSTIQEGQFHGGVEGGNITLFRAARVGEAMLALFHASSKERY